MKKVIALLLIALIALVVGCIFSDDKKSDDGGSGGGGPLKAENYLPLVKDATREWTSTDNTGYSYTYTETITGTRTSNGKTYWVLASEDGESLIRISNNIVYTLVEENMLAKAHARQVSLSGQEIPIVNFNKSVGQTWQILSETQKDEGFSMTVIWTGKYIGLKDVTVSSGTFKNCATFENTMESEYSSELWKGKFLEVDTTYFAPGIGPVKAVYTYKDYEDEKLTAETTETDEVNYYNIPGGPSGGKKSGGL